MNLNSLLALILILPLAACGEAKFTGKSKSKGEPNVSNGPSNPEMPTIPVPGESNGEAPTPENSNPQVPGNPTPGSETPNTNTPGTGTPNPQNPGKGPDSPVPGTTPNPNVPGTPIGGDPTEDCVTQNGTIVPCPEDPSTDPGQS